MALARSEPPGRAKSQVAAATATSTKIAYELKTTVASCAPSSPRSHPFRAWKITHATRTNSSTPTTGLR